MLLLLVAIGATASDRAVAQAPEQREVRVAVRQLEPFVTRSEGGRYSGFSIDLWEEIAQRNGYRTTYVEVATVNEMLAAVRSGRADAAITAVSITADREQTVDFSLPMFDSGLQVAVPASDARESGGVWETLTSPTVVLILLIMLLSILVAALIVWLIERRDNPDFAHQGVKGVFEGVWWAVVTLLTVGYGDRVTKTAAGRAFSMLFMIFGVLLVATFTATFTANLTVRELQTDIRSVSDLPGKRVVTIGGTTSATYLREHSIAFDAVGYVDDMVGRLERREADAAVYDAPVLTWEASGTQGARIRLVGAPFTREYYGIALPQDSDLQEPIDVTLLDLYQDGSYIRLYDSWFGT